MLETDLRNREERFRLIAQSTNDIFYEWIVKTGELRWFGDIDTALGYQKGEIEHSLDAWLRVIHPEDRPSLDDAVKLHTNSTETINYVYRVIRKDGSLRYWHDHSLPILESDNKPEKWVGGISDITGQEQAEQEKAELEAKGEKPELLDAARNGEKDDLTQIKGIGPKVEDQLNEAGIYHFDQIATWTEANIKWLEINTTFAHRATKDLWVSQAKSFK